MLKELNLTTIDSLFSDIPKNIRAKTLTLPSTQTEQAVEAHMRIIGKQNQSSLDHPMFLAGGIKPHYIPAAVKTIPSRSEFYTAYTPYQAEASQGFLQAMFEYQSLICELTGMDVANASLYDGATALGEAALMCMRITRKNTFLVPTNITWDKRCVLENYTKGAGMNVIQLPYNQKTGTLDIASLKDHLTEHIAGLYIENPNYFGLFEHEISHIHTLLKKEHILFVVGIDPISLGIVNSPGTYGADIVIGEGRALGNPMDFGGSGLGLFACKKEHIRQIPGRIIGRTQDADGHPAYCMTLQTREQHIRRGRATSNICTNEGLNALTALAYLAILGQNGLYDLSYQNFIRAKQVAKKIWDLPGYDQVFSGTHFNEFVVHCHNIKNSLTALHKHGIHGGIDLSNTYPELKNCLLFGITETHTEQQINQLISVLKEVE